MTSLEFWLQKPVSDAIGRLRDRKIAIDVGANAGLWTLPLSESFDTVIAAEPDERVSFDVPENATLLRVVVCGHTGEETLHLRSTTGHNSILEKHPIGGDGMADVPVVESRVLPCVTLDDLSSDGADFVKIDVEGGECEVLSGCRDIEKWERTVFLVECHDTFNDVLRELIRLGKSVTMIPHPLHAHPGHCWAIGE
jgi:FkbM family methyltransferase